MTDLTDRRRSANAALTAAERRILGPRRTGDASGLVPQWAPVTP